MANRNRRNGFSRKEGQREPRTPRQREQIVSFNFKYLDQSQPSSEPQSLKSWAESGLLQTLVEKLRGLSSMTIHEARNQRQIKVYKTFPPSDKTDFSHPTCLTEDVCWAVIMNIGGQKSRVAGFIEDSTFYVVFLDKDHRFWIADRN